MGKDGILSRIKFTDPLQRARSTYSIVSISDVTEGALEVWRGLPESIRQDPSLASFRQQNEKLHGESKHTSVQPLVFFFFFYCYHSFISLPSSVYLDIINADLWNLSASQTYINIIILNNRDCVHVLNKFEWTNNTPTLNIAYNKI